MSTYFSAPLSLPTASVPAFIALAGPAESARESLSAEAQMGLDKVFEADGTLSGQAQMLLAPIREDSTPLTQFAVSPRYPSSGVRRQCAFIAPGQSTILSSLKEPETTQVYLAETHDVPQIVAEFSSFPSLKNRFDGPKRVPIEFIDAANSSRGSAEIEEEVVFYSPSQGKELGICRVDKLDAKPSGLSCAPQLHCSLRSLGGIRGECAHASRELSDAALQCARFCSNFRHGRRLGEVHANRTVGKARAFCRALGSVESKS